ncbi:hypothetical protein KQX54_020066 [Cotesia glomerata]|uniref:Uncharacterized protein n=1 Tax=Cotesia glomerata TaxID=32391 RepID=A0AAV7HZ87_COTGL|nr:hypothetical protein KQX54_020066 [Cotesia glomerata]
MKSWSKGELLGANRNRFVDHERKQVPAVHLHIDGLAGESSAETGQTEDGGLLGQYLEECSKVITGISGGIKRLPGEI